MLKQDTLAGRTLYFSSLGCSKNLVDSQVMLGSLVPRGMKLVSDPGQAEIIVLNTCSFIEAAKKESIDTILELADYKDPQNGKCKVLAVSGCMPQRYSQELEVAMPEVDLFIGTGEYHRIANLIIAHEEGSLDAKSFVEIPKFIHTEFDPRINTSPSYTAWLKVSEGCDRNCTFCIIPTIRGRQRSRSVNSLVIEATQLAKTGVKELGIISQDLSNYGRDLEGTENLANLLRGLESVEGIEWIRLFYYYPEDLTEEVMDIIAKSNKVLPYLDMPVQHFSSSVLKRMNRKITGEEIHAKIARLRAKIPHIVLRTSIIVGFPGESDSDFDDLLTGIQKARFDHLGIFRYSDEEGTPAIKLSPKVPQDIIEERFDILHQTQKEIVEENSDKYLGKVLEVLVEGAHEETELLIQGRHRGQAPDIDGKVIINDLNNQRVRPRDLIQIKVTNSIDYNLIKKIIPKI